MGTRKEEPKRFCRFCKKRLARKIFSGRLEDLAVFVKRIYCDRACMSQGMVKKEVSKSAHHWRARRHRKEVCDRCGSPENLHVHHKDEDWANDDPGNHETICEKCHGKEHGEKRGRLLASRQWIEKEAFSDIVIVLRDSYELLARSDDAASKEMSVRIGAILHRNGQL